MVNGFFTTTGYACRLDPNSGQTVLYISRIIAGLAAVALLGAIPLAPAQAAQITIQANANVVKALEFRSKQDLDFGTIMPAATGITTVSMTMAGAVSCPATATCMGTTQPAIFNVQGVNRQVVRIFITSSDLVNATNGNRISFTPVAPASITLTNSGSPGFDFNVGGSIAIPSTADGTYSGNIEITAEYQ